MDWSSQTLSLSTPPTDLDDLWVWQGDQDLRWLTCRLLHPWPHGFMTRHAHPHKPDRLATGFDLQGQRAAWAHQVHGRQMLGAETILTAETRPQGDAVIGQQPGDSVWVCTADCVPILLGSTQSHQVAAIHAGWRGTAASISGAVMAHWLEQGITPQSVWAAIGPAISGEAYQVSQGVADQVLQTLPGEERELALLPDPEPERVRLDLKQVNRLQLIHTGIPTAQISVSPQCTRDQPEQFFSYRRAGGSLRDEVGRSQVQWSGIGIRS